MLLFPVLDLHAGACYRLAGIDIDGDGPAGQGFDKDLHRFERPGVRGGLARVAADLNGRRIHFLTALHSPTTVTH